MQEGPGRLGAGLAAATLLHVALLPLLGFLFGGRGSSGGPRWNHGLVVELLSPDPVPAAEVASAKPGAAPPVAPLAPAAAASRPPVAAAKTERRGEGVPRGRRAPRSATPEAERLAPAADAPRPAEVAGAETQGVVTESAAPPGSAGPSPAGTGPAGPDAPEASPSPGEAQAGCVATADGVVCGTRQSDVLNRPQTFMGTVVVPGYEERTYPFARENGAYVYRADSHNTVTIHDDGSVQIDGGPQPSDALCILGGAPLPWDIPDIPQYQYDELEQATAGLRHDLADRQQGSWEDDALRGLPAELAAAVSRGGRTPAEQRRFLFRRWDECTESGSGRQARAIIERFIRERCPQGGPLGYTAEELAELNRGRASVQPFCPYGC